MLLRLRNGKFRHNISITKIPRRFLCVIWIKSAGNCSVVSKVMLFLLGRLWLVRYLDVSMRNSTGPRMPDAVDPR